MVPIPSPLARGAVIAGLLAATGCATTHTRIQLLDRLDPATQTYRSCRDLHVVQLGETEYFYQYAIRGDGTPELSSLRCRGIVLPDSGMLELGVQMPPHRDAAEKARQTEAARRLSERLAHARHPVPEDGQWIFLPGPGHVESCLLMAR